MTKARARQMAVTMAANPGFKQTCTPTYFISLNIAGTVRLFYGLTPPSMGQWIISLGLRRLGLMNPILLHKQSSPVHADRR